MFRLTRWITFRSIRGRFLRFTLSGFGIMLGVAAILAINVTNQTALDSIVELFQDTSGKAKLTIVSASTESSQGFSDHILQTVRSLPGISAAAPITRAQTTLADQSESAQLGIGIFGASVGGGVEVFGIDPGIDPQLHTYNLVEGRFLGADLSDREIVFVKDFAEDQKIKVGQWLNILTPNGIERVKVVGLIAKEGTGRTNDGAFGIMPIHAVQDLFNRPNKLDQIDILPSVPNPDQATLDSLMSTLQLRLGKEISVTYPASQGKRMTQMLQNYQIGLNFISGVALFVGAFLIYNAFAMTVIERTREFGMLRTIGMTRSQVTRQMLLEASFLGFLGSLAGIGAGIFLSRALTRVMEFILNQGLQDVKFPVNTILTSFWIGLVVTFLAAMVPAWQAGRISPMEALRVRGKHKEGWLFQHGWILGLVLLVISIGVLIWNPFPYDVQFRLGSLTVFALFTGATLLIPVTIGSWERASRPFLKLFYGASGALGSRNVQRSRQRTTLTVAALMIGVAMVIMTRSMTQSFAGDLRTWMKAYIGGDIYIGSSIPLRSDVARRIESVPGVATVAPIRYFNVDWRTPGGDTQTINFMAFNPASYIRVTNFVFSGDQPDLNSVVNQLIKGNSVLLSSVLAEKFGLGAGDQIILRTNLGYTRFTIAAIVVDFYNQGLVVQGNWDDMRRYFRINDASTYMVKVKEGYPINEVQQHIDDLYGKRYRLTLESNLSVRNRALNLMDQAFSMFDVMALIAVVVGALGVFNTLTMSVIERTQEIGMLRAVGMTRRQVVQMILAEAGILGIFGGILGLATGYILARVLFTGMTVMSGYSLTFVMPVDGFAVTLLAALIVSQLAALFPARRAARIKILEAVHYE